MPQHSGFRLRSDEYYGRPAVDVIRTILEKRKRANLGAATVSEIYNAMVAGGYQFQTDNDTYAKRGIYSIIARESVFHQIPGGGVGLASWYPAAKPKTPEDEVEPKNKLKSRLKATPNSRTSKLKSRLTPTVPQKPLTDELEAVSGGNETTAEFGKGDLLKMVTEIVQSLPQTFSTADVVVRLEKKMNSDAHQSRQHLIGLRIKANW